MNIIKIIKSTNGIDLNIYDQSLVLLETESFTDTFTLNFYLQTMQKKNKIQNALLIVHDIDNNHVDLIVPHDESPFFV